MLRKLFHLIFPCYFHDSSCQDNFFGCKCGKGDKKPEAPKYQEDPATSALKNRLSSQVSGLLDIPYEEYVSRFTPSAQTGQFLTDSLKGYKGMMDTEDYGLADYDQTEKNYLDTIQGQYSRSREEAYKPIQESLIAENLFGSGPGYDIMGKFGKETAQGSADITANWAREGIDRRFQQKSYQDALKRGDYTTMYSLALNEANREVQPKVQATEAQLGAINPAMGLFGEMNQVDIAKYNAAMEEYKVKMAKGKKNLGGLGTALGIGAGLLLAPATGGTSAMLMSGALGGSAGGGLGSMFEY